MDVLNKRREFGQRGFIVVPEAVNSGLIDVANRQIDAMIAKEPPPDGHRGAHFYWRRPQGSDPFLRALRESPAFSMAQSLIAPGSIEVPTQAQVSLIMPAYDHRPGGPHIDGTSPPEPDGRPGTFTMLAGILLSDQSAEDMGNLWVWPGTHLTHEAYFRRHGPDALMKSRGYPQIELPTPCQVKGRAGDLLLAHYMLGHNIGGNTSSIVRRVLYFRLFRDGHRARWRECLQDAWLEFDNVRAAMR